jgi:ectoine hydroxylase-related dioxygenase (phytanoyl-CoA dioxygenase family)
MKVIAQATLTAPAAFFQAAGYLRVPHLLDVAQVDQLRDLAYQIAEDADHEHVGQSPEKTRIDQVVSLNSTYQGVAMSGQVLDALEPVLGPNIELVENRHNHVSIYRTASADRLHRDILQWSRSILTLLVYLSDCTDLDSATRVVPGSHLWPCIGKPNNGGTWMAEVEPYSSLLDQAVAVPAAAGDAVLMHGQLYHAGAGVSPIGHRIVLTLAYRSVDELAEEPSPRCRLVRGSRIHRGRGAARV